jgi:acyl carrier protein
MDQVRDVFQEVFRDVFDDPTLDVTDNMTADDVDGWDSLTHINLIIALEKRFRIKFATAEISRLKDEGSNVGSIIALVTQKSASSR